MISGFPVKPAMSMSEVERADVVLVEPGEEGAGPGGGVGAGEGAGPEEGAGAGGKGTGGVQLPPGHHREEEQGRDGKRRRFVICPGGRRFERWQDVKPGSGSDRSLCPSGATINTRLDKA